jgi:hypothetical protein
VPVPNPHTESYKVKKVEYLDDSTIRLTLKEPSTGGDLAGLGTLHLYKVKNGTTRTGSEYPEDKGGSVILTENSTNHDFSDAKKQIAENDVVSYLSTKNSSTEAISQFTWS